MHLSLIPCLVHCFTSPPAANAPLFFSQRETTPAMKNRGEFHSEAVTTNKIRRATHCVDICETHATVDTESEARCEHARDK